MHIYGSKILHFIDLHYTSKTLGGAQKRGSGPLTRELQSHHCNSDHSPPAHLPINLYDPGLGHQRIQMLNPKPQLTFPKVHIPNVVPPEMMEMD